MPEPLARSERLILRSPERRDEDSFIEAVRDSQSLHHPWVDPPSDAFRFRAYLDRLERPDHFGFLAETISEGDLVGVVNINNVVMGAFRSGYMGYYGYRSSGGNGLMTEAVELTVSYAFESLGLHRLEANIQPANVRSIRLVERLGFRYEGLSPDYLFINSAWRDHERWAITDDRVSSTSPG